METQATHKWTGIRPEVSRESCREAGILPVLMTSMLAVGASNATNAKAHPNIVIVVNSNKFSSIAGGCGSHEGRTAISLLKHVKFS